MITVLVINVFLLIIAVVLLLTEKFLVTYGESIVTVNHQRKFRSVGGEDLLSCLTQNKIFIPSACGGKATCGFCKVKVISGAGRILPTEEVYIERDERQQGVRLACQVKIRQNVSIHIPEYLLEAEEFQAETTKIISVTHDIKLIRFRMLDSKVINFKPGQYIQLKIPGTDEFRAYSVATPPYIKDRLELIVRLVPGGLCSAYVHNALEERDKVVFTGSFGDFFLHEENSKHIVAIGGGCGMAPIRSIVYHMAKKGMPRRFYYFFGARSKRDLFFTEEFRNIEKEFPNFKYITALSEPLPEDNWDGETGFITQVADKYLDNETPKEAYLCGPPPMIDAAIKILTKKNIREDEIYFDKF